MNTRAHAVGNVCPVIARTPRWLTCVLLAGLLIATSATELVAQTLAKHKFTRGWSTFGLALPPGAATSGLAVGSYLTQTDVKTRWDDGSIRLAIVTANIATAGTHPIVPSTISSGSIADTWPTAEVKLVIGSTTWTASLPAGSSDPWLSGPLVSEGRVLVAPAAGGAAHPFLRVLYDVRSYAGGGNRVDVTVQSTMNVAATTRVTYNVAIDVNGAQVFQQNAVQHPALMRWRKVFRVGLTESSITPDLGSFFAAAAIPRYVSSGSVSSYSTSGSTFGILRPGGLNPRMPDPGGRPELAPYPEWVADYVTGRRFDALQYTLKHGDLAGSWSIHLSEPDGSLLTIDNHPIFWFHNAWVNDGYHESFKMSPNDLGYFVGGVQEQMEENAHVPSLALVPYLLTGDRYYADEVMYWANISLINQHSYDRRDSQGIIANNQTRGMAWSLRNLVDAAVWLPDTHPNKGYFAEKIRNSLAWFDQSDAETIRPLGSWKEQGEGGNNGFQIMAPWQNAYLVWALNHANRQGFTAGTRMMDRLARFQLRLFTDPQWRREEAGVYYAAMGQSIGNTVVWFPDLPTVRAKTIEQWGGTSELMAITTYCVDIRFSLLAAQARGMTGASDAITWLMAQPYTIDSMKRRPGYALTASDFGPPDRRLGTDTAGGPAAPSNLRVVGD